MKEQFLARVLLKYDEQEGKWTNAMMIFKNNRYAKTYEEAKQVIDMAIARGESNKPRTTRVGNIGIMVEPDKDNGLKVVKWEIKKRMVTEWELV